MAHNLFFPFVLLGVVFILTLAKVSGSSIGYYHEFFYGKNAHDSHLLTGSPRGVRSDEWLFNSQMIMAQANAGFPRVNHNLGVEGMDMSVIVDVPYKDWSALFKPHNLPFLVLPFDFAFAFRWWLFALLLACSAYFFILRIFPGKKKLAILISLLLTFSPMVQWWYQYITLAPIFYALFALLSLVNLYEAKTTRTKVLWGSVFAYVTTCFALVLYPPFQIPVALVALAIYAAWLSSKITRYDQKTLRTVLIKHVPALIGVAVAGLLTGLFIATRLDTIHTITGTAYPGKRVVKTGGHSLNHFNTSNFAPLMQNNKKAAAYTKKGFNNQSESSSFALPMTGIALLSGYLGIRLFKKKRKEALGLLILSGATLLLFGRLFISFKPLDLFYKALLLESVPHNRVVLGIGLLSIFTLAYLVALARKDFLLPLKERVAVLIGLSAFYVYMSFLLDQAYPAVMQGIGELIVIVGFFPLFLGLFMWGYRYSALAVAVAFTLYASLGIHPLYRSTSVLQDTPLAQAMRDIDKEQNTRWIVTDAIALENMAFATGEESISGDYFYPQKEIWQSIDPEKKQEDTYNRYAHAVFLLNKEGDTTSPKITLRQGDYFTVRTAPCDNFLDKIKVRYIASPEKRTDSCLKLRRTVTYPHLTYFVYERR